MKAKQPRHVMIDIETMGKTPNHAIVSIGAVIFDPRYNIVTDDTFYTDLDWRTQDRKLCRETKDWWKRQSSEARRALKGTELLQDALEDLDFWLPKDCKVWGNGSHYDISFLEDGYRQHNQEIPWEYWNVRDCRTVRDMYESKRGGLTNMNFKNPGNAHNALDDAIHQATWVTKCWNKLLGDK